uniref:Uncharacterized protein n=1 Tax=Myoviridae sp. ctByu2 TaxID=2827668 RepID=A0A8S5S986_9CAUD|nr:MAG TPA: hypothetical protein [Myoviridae sp. ctByu2]
MYAGIISEFLDNPLLARMCLVWLFTVKREICSLSAISFSEKPLDM